MRRFSLFCDALWRSAVKTRSHHQVSVVRPSLTGQVYVKQYKKAKYNNLRSTNECQPSSPLLGISSLARKVKSRSHHCAGDITLVVRVLRARKYRARSNFVDSYENEIQISSRPAHNWSGCQIIKSNSTRHASATVMTSYYRFFVHSFSGFGPLLRGH